MANLTRTQLEYAARDVGLTVSTWSPGDGMTRYRFSDDGQDYFACQPLYTALGIAEAVTWFRGYASGYHAAARTTKAA